MANFDGRMPRAPRDGSELLLLVCTDDDHTPIAREVGWWDAELKRWEGDWRYYDGEGGYAASEPIAWALLPEVDQEFLDLLTPKAAPEPKAKATTRLAPATIGDADEVVAPLTKALAEKGVAKEAAPQPAAQAKQRKSKRNRG